MLTMVLFLTFTCAVLFASFGIPYILKTMVEVNKKRAKDFSKEMERTMIEEDIRKVSIFYVIGPFALAAIGFILLPLELRAVGVVAGGVVGFIIPRTYAGMLISKRKQQFENQLIDGLMIMSSSFRGGLSLVQAVEAVVEEMGDPIRQEFGFVLSENKMGVALDDALNRLYKRLPSPSLQQMVTAVLLARETGGNLPIVFSRIVTTLRERKKIEENITVLTLQGRLQAVVMSGLPVAFFFMVSNTNPKYFNVMLGTEMGRMLLITCAVLWVVGTFFIIKISTFKDF